MNTLTKSIAVAVLHILIVLSVGGKMLYDRAHLPRVWVKAYPSDARMPVRGRYFPLQLQVQVACIQAEKSGVGGGWVTLAVENGALVAHKSDVDTGVSIAMYWQRQECPSQPNQRQDLYLDQVVPFFLPEHAPELPQRKPGEELWAEVTVPRKGPPRPIQLALKRGTEWKPLTYR